MYVFEKWIDWLWNSQLKCYVPYNIRTNNVYKKFKIIQSNFVRVHFLTSAIDSFRHDLGPVKIPIRLWLLLVLELIQLVLLICPN